MDCMSNGPTNQDGVVTGMDTAVPCPAHGFTAALTALRLGRFAPRKAGMIAQHAPLGIWLTISLSIALLCGVTILITAMLCTALTKTASGYTTYHTLVISWNLATISDIWADWHAGGPVGPAEFILGGTTLGILAVVICAALLHVSTTRSGGSFMGAYVASLKACCACLSLATAFIFILCFGHGWIWAIESYSHVDELLGFLFVTLHMLLTALLLNQFARACFGARRTVPRTENPPWCERCGYDLTHHVQGGRCSECGESIDWSLTENHKRMDSPWKQQQGIMELENTSRFAVTGLSNFYSRLRVYGKDHDYRVLQFSLWTYIAIGIGSAIWTFAFLVFVDPGDPPGWVLVCLPTMASFACPLAGWCMHRATVLAVMFFNYMHHRLPNPAVAWPVIAYETSYLWMYCLFNGSYLLSVVIFDDTAEYFLGKIVPGLGMPWGVLIFFAGNAALYATGCWRLNKALGEVRWANF